MGVEASTGYSSMGAGVDLVGTPDRVAGRLAGAMAIWSPCRVSAARESPRSPMGWRRHRSSAGWSARSMGTRNPLAF
jgi:hypothetical protein